MLTTANIAHKQRGEKKNKPWDSREMFGMKWNLPEAADQRVKREAELF